MNKDIGKTLSQAIIEKKLVKITYENLEKSKTKFIVGIVDVDFRKRILKVILFNEYYFLNNEAYENYKIGSIKFNKIESAYILDLTTYKQPRNLISKIEANKEKFEWLGYDFYTHNVLNYYKECDLLNGDPARRDYFDIPGIDISVLAKNGYVELTDEQNALIFDQVLNEYSRQNADKTFILILNRLSICRADGKIYVIAHNVVRYNPILKQLVLENKVSFNLSFIYFKDTRKSLEEFVDGDLEQWMDEYKKDPQTAIDKLHLRINERADTKPHLLMLEQQTHDFLNMYYSYIANLYFKKQLNKPLKAFFGQLSSSDYKPNPHEPYIISIDEKLNKTQLKVIYNALKYPITYVQGPPGTGKTQTILNVVLSNLFLNRTTLVCSNNNQAVDSVLAKFNIVYNGKNVPLPYLRYGNKEVTEAAINRIIELYNYDLSNLQQVVNEAPTINRHQFKLKNLDVLKALESNEHYEYLTNCIDDYHQLIDNNEENEFDTEKLKDQLQILETAKSKYQQLNYKSIENNILTISKDKDLTKYFYYFCLSKIAKLHSEEYNELIDICRIEDSSTRVKEFNKYINNAANMKSLSKVFPIIFSTNISTYRLGGPTFLFDLVIIDEAAQCDIPISIIPISKANSLLLVGDVKQLKPVITISLEANKKLLEEFDIKEKDKYDFYFNSIYSTMLKTDRVSNEFMLDYHYRSGKKIIEFSNHRYYEAKLKVLTDTEDALELYDINNFARDQKNAWLNEATEIVKYIERNNVEDCQIVTPFYNQAFLINNMLREKNLDDKIKAGTIHSLQGAEKDTIIFSPAISHKTSALTYKWINNNKEIINVGVTRAKKKFVVFADTKAIKRKSNNQEDDLSLLIEYIKRKGNYYVPPTSKIEIMYGRSNNSINEDELFKTIAQFCSTHKSFDVKRNVSAKSLAKNKVDVDKDYEYDFVIYKKNLYEEAEPHLIIELNGGEHLGTIDIEKNDEVKRRIANKLGIQTVTIPNTYSRRYDIIELLLSNNKTLQNKVDHMFELQK